MWIILKQNKCLLNVQHLIKVELLPKDKRLIFVMHGQQGCVVVDFKSTEDVLVTYGSLQDFLTGKSGDKEFVI